MSKLQRIIEGWSNLLIRDPEVEKFALERAEKCANCDAANDKNFCAICGCYIPAKVRSKKEKCPNGEW